MAEFVPLREEIKGSLTKQGT